MKKFVVLSVILAVVGRVVVGAVGVMLIAGTIIFPTSSKSSEK